ncbi:MAG TPA: hypothetical protein VGO64_05375 [Candidatus Limnocylindrales bacterium]|nr:hypothetical protein [Candidatus Limnocylindrales bacterium]
MARPIELPTNASWRPSWPATIRWEHVFRLVATGGVALVVARAVVYFVQIPDPAGAVGVDYRLYVGAASRWLETGVFYEPAQVAGPYHVHSLPAILYPPVILPMLVPFTVLPAVLYWLIPGALTLAAFVRMRPAAWSIWVMAVLAATDAVQGPIFWGTPVFWLMPVVAWGFLLGWPAPIVFLKPTLAPFALAGLTRPRSFVAGLLGLALLSIPFWPLWLDWLAVIRNSDLDATYGLSQVALLLVPTVAWLGRTRSRGTAAA